MQGAGGIGAGRKVNLPTAGGGAGINSGLDGGLGVVCLAATGLVIANIENGH